LVSGVYTLVKNKEISPKARSGQVYLIATFITAVSALVIFKHGGFGVAHSLAVMTLIALGVGTLAATRNLFGKLSRHMQAASYSATLLFHSIPAVTDGLMRLPVDSPILTSIEDPILKALYLVLLVLYLVGVSSQFIWIGRQPQLV
jgi:uncharacterized membrane protein